MSKILRRLVLVFAMAALCLPAQAQRFVKVFDNIPALLAANPNDVNTNAFVAGLSTIADGGGGFYTWKAGSTATTNADLSILKANNYSTGRWYRFNGFIIAGGTNQFDTIYVTNLYVTNLTVTSTNTFITNFFFNNTYITNISQGDNWVAEGLTQTNSDLAGIGRTWKLIATNSVEVGQPGDTPLIELTSPNASYTNVMSLDSSGVFTMTNNGVLLLSVDPNGGVEAISQFANGYFAATSPFGSQGRLSANGSLLLDSISGLGGSVSLSPGAPTNNTPFTLVDNNDLGPGSLVVIGSGGGTIFILYADGPILVENNGVTNFYISTPSGYTGTGTNYLSDGGNYHAVDTLTDGADFIEVIGGKAYFSAGLDLGSDSSPFGPVDDIQMEGTLNVFGSGVGTANYEKFTIDHQGSSGVILDSVAGGSGTSRDILFRIGGQGKVKITSGALVPANSADYNLGATPTANSFWNDVFSKGIYYTYGFGEGTADTESGAFYHNGSSALITESLSAGSGVARDFYWKSNGVTVDVLALNSGYTGAGTKVKTDNGTYQTMTSPPGTVATNININPTDLTYPYRSNSTTFADGPLKLQSAGSSNLITLGKMYATSQFITASNAANYSDLSRNGYGFLAGSDRTVDGVGTTRLVMESANTSNYLSQSFIEGRTRDTASLQDAFLQVEAATNGNYFLWEIQASEPTQSNNHFQYQSNGIVLFQIDGSANVIFGPGTTNVLYRSAKNLIYTNGSTVTFFTVTDGSARTMSIGLNGSGLGEITASTGNVYTDNKFGVGASPRTYLDVAGGVANVGTLLSLTGDDTTVGAGDVSLYFINSDNNTAANRTMHLNNNGIRGQELNMVVQNNAAQLLNADSIIGGSGTLKLSADWNGTTWSSINLRCDGTNWIETARSVK